jgi:hypothetical protein
MPATYSQKRLIRDAASELNAEHPLSLRAQTGIRDGLERRLELPTTRRKALTE